MSDYETKKYKGFQIRAHRDDDSSGMNPADMDDSFPPCVKYYLDRHHGKVEAFGFNDGFDWDEICRLIEPKHCRSRDQRVRLCELLDKPYQEFLDDGHRYYSGRNTVDVFINWFTDQRREMPYGWRDAIEYFDALEELCKIVGLPVYNTKSNGHNQGDCVLIMAVATEKWQEFCGFDRKTHDVIADLKGNVESFCSWAWGDVYGWTIHRPVEKVDEDDDDEWEDDSVESCWGYYGDDHDESGLWQAAMQMVDCIIESDESKRVEREAREEKERIEREACECRGIITV